MDHRCETKVTLGPISSATATYATYSQRPYESQNWNPLRLMSPNEEKLS